MIGVVDLTCAAEDFNPLLTGLRERAEALGGTLKLTSPPGRGTSVDVRLPTAADRRDC
jgi:glucose-6-phosphate-specific signal transduction histidine kinase